MTTISSVGGNCQVATKLAPVIAAYGAEDLLEALAQQSETWKVTRDKFRASYLQSNNAEEVTKCLSPVMHTAVDDGDLVVAISLYNDNDDVQEQRNADEFARKSLVGIAESTQRMIQNLRSSSDRPVSVFVLSSREMDKIFDNQLCGSIGDCKVNYLVQGPLNAFVTMCASDLLVMTAHSDMAMYTAALCSNHAVLAPSSLAYVDVFPNRVFADTVHIDVMRSHKLDKNQINQNSETYSLYTVEKESSRSANEWVNTRADNYTIDKLSTQLLKARERSLLIFQSWDRPTCRDSEILEPTEQQVLAGEQSCRFRESPVEFEKMRNDFDLLRWAVDVCESEFHEGNEHSRRLFSSHRTAVACVSIVAKRMMMLIEGSVNSFEELREEGRFDVLNTGRSKVVVDSNKDMDNYLFSDILKHQNKYNVKCESN